MLPLLLDDDEVSGPPRRRQRIALREDGIPAGDDGVGMGLGWIRIDGVTYQVEEYDPEELRRLRVASLFRAARRLSQQQHEWWQQQQHQQQQQQQPQQQHQPQQQQQDGQQPELEPPPLAAFQSELRFQPPHVVFDVD